MVEEADFELEPTVDLDLDALVIEPKKVRLPGGAVVLIHMPELSTLFSLTKLGNRIDALNSSKKPATDAQKVKLFEEIKEAFIELIPELQPYSDQLNDAQVVALIQFIAKMSMPKDLDELQKRGITLDDDKKKVLRDFLGQ